MPHDARVPFLKGEYMKKRVLAIAAIVILAGLYVACLVLALIHSDAAFKLLQLTLVMTVLVPVTAGMTKTNWDRGWLGQGSDTGVPELGRRCQTPVPAPWCANKMSMKS